MDITKERRWCGKTVGIIHGHFLLTWRQWQWQWETRTINAARVSFWSWFNAWAAGWGSSGVCVWGLWRGQDGVHTTDLGSAHRSHPGIRYLQKQSHKMTKTTKKWQRILSMTSYSRASLYGAIPYCSLWKVRQWNKDSIHGSGHCKGTNLNLTWLKLKKEIPDSGLCFFHHTSTVLLMILIVRPINDRAIVNDVIVRIICNSIYINK